MHNSFLSLHKLYTQWYTLLNFIERQMEKKIKLVGCTFSQTLTIQWCGFYGQANFFPQKNWNYWWNRLKSNFRWSWHQPPAFTFSILTTNVDLIGPIKTKECERNSPSTWLACSKQPCPGWGRGRGTPILATGGGGGYHFERTSGMTKAPPFQTGPRTGLLTGPVAGLGGTRLPYKGPMTRDQEPVSFPGERIDRCKNITFPHPSECGR